MLNIYTSFICCKCQREHVLLTDDLKSFKGYLSCPFCSSRHVKKQKTSDNLKDCMKERAYIRVNGALRQVRQD